MTTGTYPDHETYRKLYARFVDRHIPQLVEHLVCFSGMHVLDLCAGEGRVTRAVLDAGAQSVMMVDQEQAMISKALLHDSRVRIVTLPAHEALRKFAMSGLQFDRVVCRQGVNYWLHDVASSILASVVKQGGIFVFNTFNQKPAKKPRVLTYELGGHEFVEVSWLVGDTVHHVQVRDDMEPHTTAFRWISPEQFQFLLWPHFNVSVTEMGKTSIYHCVKK